MKVVNLFHIVETGILFAEMVFENLHSPKIESHIHRELFIFLWSFFFLLLILLWFSSLPRWKLLILLLSLLKIMEHELLKDLVFILRVAKFLGHQRSNEQQICKFFMVFPIRTPTGLHAILELKFTPKSILKHFHIYYMPINELKIVEVNQLVS